MWTCIQSSGIELSGLTLEPLASSDAVLSQKRKEAGVALIDIGGGTTDLAILKMELYATPRNSSNVISDDMDVQSLKNKLNIKIWSIGQ
jgi:cell division protein FtsA